MKSMATLLWVLRPLLTKRGLFVERQKPIPVFYESEQLDVAFRADLVVEKKVLVELKSVEAVTALFKKITTNYIRLIPLKLGFLINFNEVHLKNGIMRVTNGLEGKPFFHSTSDQLDVDFRKPSSPSRSLRDSGGGQSSRSPSSHWFTSKR